MPSVYLLATLDTKGDEIAYVAGLIRGQGIAATVADTGCLGEASTRADITRDQLFEVAGTTLEHVRSKADRGFAVSEAARGAKILVSRAYDEGQLCGVLGIGGSAGTSIATTAMRALPLGIPKVMVSTLASGDVRAFVGTSDIAMINSVVDISGLNRISRTVLAQAAHAMIGMVRYSFDTRTSQDRPLVAATMFGVTTPCIEHARTVLEQAGYEVLVFHATGSGGQAMESLIRDGLIEGVLDITTTELADELVGGVLSAGPSRLTAAGEAGVPQVVSVGATDMVNFWALDTVPEGFRDRKLYKHNDNVTLMRTVARECRAIGEAIGCKLVTASGPTAILLPSQGVSAIDREGQPFDDPAARQALFDGIQKSARGINVLILDCHINDEEFASAAARKLMELMREKGKG